jgi:hypothetical protein
MALVRGPERVGKDQKADDRILTGSWAKAKND